MSEQPVRLCLCGHCQQHWLQNGWVCPELLRPVGTMRTEQPPEDPWQEDPWLSAAVWGQDGWRRARGSTDGMTQGWNSWTDPWLEQDPWSEASATNGTWRRPREVYPRDARDPWEESTPAVGQREERWLEWTEWAPPRGDPWTAPGADPWGAYDPWAETTTRAPGPWTRRRLHNRQQNAWSAWGGPRDDRLTPDGRFLEPDRSVSPRPNWNAEPEHMEVPRIIEWPGATWLDPLAQAMGALDRPRGPAWLDERTGRDPWDILTMEQHWNLPIAQLARRHLRFRGGWPDIDSGSDSEDPELIRALEESLRTAEVEENRRVTIDHERQLGLTGRCVVCLEEKKGGATCVCSETGAPGSSNESPPGGTERLVHFLCQDCIPMYVENELDHDDGSDRRLMERRAFGHCLRCPCSPMPMDCKGFMEERHVRSFLSPPLWSKLQAASEADEKHRQWQKESRDNEDPEFLREALLRSMPNAVQCGSCHYGPIDHAGCDDLDAHHWQWQGNSQIQNQCPKCGWWAHSIDSWPAWDGVIRQD